MTTTKALPFNIPKPSQASIIVQENKEPRFYDKLHEHTEVQFSYLLSGEGTLFAGNSIVPYHKNQLVVLNSNVPHLFRTTANPTEDSHRISVFFDADWYYKLIGLNPELKTLEFLLAQAKTGFVINDPTGSLVPLFDRLLKRKLAKRFLSFIELVLALKEHAFTTLEGDGLAKPYSTTDGARMRNILEYTLAHYPDAISIKDAAKQTALTPHAFCKYFKKRTGKTYINFLNQVRIEASCRRLLEQPDSSIAAIAYSCGFSSLSNFNRQFKRIKATTPRKFRRAIVR